MTEYYTEKRERLLKNSLFVDLLSYFSFWFLRSAKTIILCRSNRNIFDYFKSHYTTKTNPSSIIHGRRNNTL